ncbi:amidohydrolase family protein [Chryseolinea lacunae]|uniref:Amidohydrolase family protein n=1 Tax=Chryseolinea lacunae TaxID=2801331 RepID=A0ABS1KZ34_9BACT|nr:amidohydrolase family protein [Chryseolinea lacunae]MBL0744492.1 amidohydrolase family protein [Chryseolinea lacunae]
MARIDAHQHFWRFDPVRDSWINDDMLTIRRDFLPADLKPVLDANGIDGCVIVQSDQSETENFFQLDNANRHDFIKGVVGWVDFKSPEVEARLDYYSTFAKMKGFRHVLQGERQRDYMLDPAFMQGIEKLNAHNFTYDILIYPDQLVYTKEFLKAFPHQRFVIDHLAKPDIKSGDIAAWKKNIEAVAAFENVHCKVSGMVTEADWKHWTREDFAPCLDTVTEAFGTSRLLFGSDWPVCLVAATYAEAFNLVKEYYSAFSKNEQDAIFGNNAIQFYNL